MNASDLTFGVELETTISRESSIRVGGYHSGADVEGFPGWKAERDSSISYGPGQKPCEFVSPVLRGADGIREVLRMVDHIKDNGGEVNTSCGFHVHVGVKGLTAAQIKQVVRAFAKHEKALYASTGTTRREQGSYCRPIKGNASYEALFKDGQGIPKSGHNPDMLAGNHDFFERYHSLNITNLFGRRAAIEVRVFAGTLNPTKIVAYIRLCLALVEKALKAAKELDWDLRESASAVKKYPTPGARALALAFYDLGWLKSDVKDEHGLIAGDGIPTTAACMTELRRLAKKYDGISTPGAGRIED